jgi:hypothetical protein
MPNSLNSVDTFLDYELGNDKDISLGTYDYYLRKYDRVPMTVHDARGYENLFSLDRNAFEFVKYQSEIADGADNWTEEVIKDVAYPEIVKLVKQR